MRDDQPIEVLDRSGRELDPGHELEIVERDRVPGISLGAPELRTLVAAVDPVEDGDDVIRVGVGIIDGPRHRG